MCVDIPVVVRSDRNVYCWSGSFCACFIVNVILLYKNRMSRKDQISPVCNMWALQIYDQETDIVTVKLVGDRHRRFTVFMHFVVKIKEKELK